jgi:hypothetical protein
MDALRTELRDYFWDGEFRDTVGATVINEKKPHHPYAVFINARTGKSGLVICNYEENAAVTVTANLDSGEMLSCFRLVDNSDWHSVQKEIIIPAQSAVVVI